jgi:hypothetical protein
VGRATSSDNGEAKEETKGLGTSKERNGDQRINRGKRERGFNTMSKGNLKCVVQTCKNNHPPWTCDAFKALSVLNRKALIKKSKRSGVTDAWVLDTKQLNVLEQYGVASMAVIVPSTIDYFIPHVA